MFGKGKIAHIVITVTEDEKPKGIGDVTGRNTLALMH